MKRRWSRLPGLLALASAAALLACTVPAGAADIPPAVVARSLAASAAVDPSPALAAGGQPADVGYPAGVEAGLIPTPVFSPDTILTDAAGDVVLGDTSNQRVVELKANGQQVTLPLDIDTVILETGEGPIELAVDAAGDVFASNGPGTEGGSTVQEYSATGVLSQLDIKGYGLAADAQGDVYVGGQMNGLGAEQVLERHPDGTTRAITFSGAVGDQVGIIGVDAAGDVFVQDEDGDVLEETPAGVQTTLAVPTATTTEYSVTPDGGLLGWTRSSAFVSKYTGGAATVLPFTGLTQPSSATADTAGDVLVADGSRVVELAAGGAQTSRDTGLVSNPGSLALDGAGDAFVFDPDKRDVIERTAAGAITTIVVSGLGSDVALAADPAGDLFLADSSDNRVVETAVGGGQSTLSFTGLSDPADVAVDSAGDVFVADRDNNRVVELPVGGSQQTLGFTGVFEPWQVSVDGSGAVYAEGYASASAEDPTVFELQDGFETSLTSLADEATSTFCLTLDSMTVDRAGDLYFSSTIIDGEHAGASVVCEVSTTGEEALYSLSGDQDPGGIAIDQSGDLYATTQGAQGGLVEFPSDLPGAPAGLTVTNGDRHARLSWTAPNDPGAPALLGYQVSPVVDGVAGPPVKVVGTSVDLSNLANGASYSFTVAAVNARGAGPATAASTPIVLGLPGAPTAVTATPGNASATLAWTPPSGDQAIDWYQVSASTGGHALAPVTIAGDSTSTTLTGLSNAASYTFTVAAMNDVGTGAQSVPTPAVTIGVPSPPTGVTATIDGYTATVAWTVPISFNGSDITGYIVTGTPAGSEPVIRQQALSTTAAVGGLLEDISYTFTVVAVNARGSSPASSPSNAVVGGTPPAPSDVTAAEGQGDSVNVSWSEPPITYGPYEHVTYDVIAIENGLAMPASSVSDSENLHLSGLEGGAVYRFEVTAGFIPSETSQPSAPSAVVVPPLGSAGTFVSRQYHDIVGRSPTAAESASAVQALDDGAASGAVVQGLRGGSDAISNVDPTVRLYFAYFLRAPDSGGLSYWVGRKRGGASLYAISDYFAGSSEFKARYGSLGNADFVTLVYQNVLGRAPDPSGDSYWLGQLNSGAKTRGQVMVGFSESAEYKALEAAPVDVAVTWIDLLGVTPPATYLNSWTAAIRAQNSSVADLAQAIFATSAYATRVG